MAAALRELVRDDDLVARTRRGQLVQVRSGVPPLVEPGAVERHDCMRRATGVRPDPGDERPRSGLGAAAAPELDRAVGEPDVAERVAQRAVDAAALADGLCAAAV